MNNTFKLLLFIFPLWASASPWLETNNAFIRADLQLLADAGMLDAPINHYPLRWSTFGDDVQSAPSELDTATSLALQQINYMLMGAKIQRGKKMSKVVYGSNSPSAAGFGQANKDEWGIYASYENMFDYFAFRVSSAYSQYETDAGSEQGTLWNGTYLSLNSGQFLFTVGAIDRWWGPSWQHNLSFANYGQANPSLSVSYLGNKLPIVGYWSAETVVEYLGSDFNYLSSSRLNAKPLSFFEFGATYQLTEKDNNNQNINQYGIDGRLSLPVLMGLYHGLFASYQFFDYNEDNSASIIGWDGQFSINENSVRIVLEKQVIEKHYFNMLNDKQRFQYNEVNSLLWGDSLSMAFYLQFINDHKMSVIYRNSEGTNDNQEESLQLDYRFPLSIGRLHLGLSQSNVTLSNSKNHETNVWSGYEIRF